MEQEQQRMDDTIAAIEAEVEAKLHRRADDQGTQFGNSKRRENTAIVNKAAITQLPRAKHTAVVLAVSTLLLVLLVVLIVLLLRLP